MFERTTATEKILKLKKRIRAISGGTSASKTISLLLILIDFAQSDKTPTLTSIVSESMPHLKKGCVRDFQIIMKAHNYWNFNRWSISNKIYTFESGSQIEFFGADQSDKLRGGRRDRLFINEANNVSFASFEELEVRTRELIFLDWNPTNEFWFYTEILPNRDDVDFIKLTYLDNEALDQNTVKSIEQRKNRKSWWRVYGLGELGEVEGKIFRGWKIIEKIPHEARLIFRGLDFGYNDPSALVAIYTFDGGFIFDEELFQKGMTNKQIADTILAQEKSQILVKADGAEPKSIDEIKMYGVNIVAAAKGGGSVSQGISFLQDQQISMTKRSVNLIHEYRNYFWESDKDGKILNVPEHRFSHSMDAVRYGLSSYRVSDEDEKSAAALRHARINQKPNYAG